MQNESAHETLFAGEAVRSLLVVVGGGIFHNSFYTKLVVAFEKQVISDGHEFILGSFTHKQKPVLLWDDLDAVVLTGVTKKTEIDDFKKTSCLLSLLDTQSSKLNMQNLPQVN